MKVWHLPNPQIECAIKIAVMKDQHECANSSIHCFDCEAVICRECMIIDFQNLRCKSCADKSVRGAGKPSGKVGAFAPKDQPTLSRRTRGETKASFGLGVAATFYSFLLFKFLNMLSFCVG